MKLPVPEKPSEALRSAIERTFEATAGPAASTRDRAGELLDEVAKRGRGGPEPDRQDRVNRPRQAKGLTSG